MNIGCNLLSNNVEASTLYPLSKILDKCSGVIFMDKEGYIALAHRSDGQGWALAGGKQEPDESPKGCAAREAFEEFKVKPKVLIELGRVYSFCIIRGMEIITTPMIYLCTEWEEELTSDGVEMTEMIMVHLNDILKVDDLFSVSRAALTHHMKVLKTYLNKE